MALGIKLVADTDGLVPKIRGVQKLFDEVGVSAAGMGNKVDNAVDGMTGSFARLEGMAKKAGTALGGMFAAERIKGFLESCIEVRQEFESLEVSFSTLLGSEEAGKKMFSDLTDFATSTPLMEKDIAQAAQTMLSFNISAEKVIPLLKAIGDVSMGSAEKFQSLVLSFSQATSLGKLQGGDKLQMINAGFNPLAEMSRTTGKTMKELDDMMGKGAITAKMLEDAFVSATSAGGKYNGMLESMSKTLQGARSNLEGAVQKFKGELGKSLEPAIVSVVNKGYEAVNSITKAFEEAHIEIDPKVFEEIGSAIEKLVVGFGAYKAAVIACTAYSKAYAAIMEMVRYQQALAAMQNVTLSASQAALAGATNALSVAWNRLTTAMSKNVWAIAAVAVASFAMEIKDAIDAEEDMRASHEKVEDAMGSAGSTYTDARDKFLKLKEAWEDLGDSLDDKKKFVDDNKDAMAKLGVKITDVASAERVFGDQSKGIVRAFELRAKAAAAAALATDAYQKFLKAQRDLEKEKGDAGFKAQDVMDLVQNAFSQLGVGSFDWEASVEEGHRRRVANAQKAVDGYEEEYKVYEEWSKGFLKEAEALEKDLGLAFASLGTIETPNSPTTSDDKKKTTPKKTTDTFDAKDAAYQSSEALRKYYATLEEETRKLSNQHNDLVIETQRNGIRKTMDALDDSQTEELDAMRKQLYDLVKGYRDAQREAWVKAGKDRKESQWTSDSNNHADDLDGYWKDQFITSDKGAQFYVEWYKNLMKIREKYGRMMADAQKAEFDSLLQQFGDYSEQRLQIEQRYSESLESLEALRAVKVSKNEKGEEDEAIARIDATIRSLRSKLKEELSQFDFDEFAKDMNLGDIAGSVEGYTTDALEKMADALRKIIASNKDLTPDGLQRLKMLNEALTQIYSVQADKNPVEALKRSLEELDASKLSRAEAQERLDSAGGVGFEGSTLAAKYAEAVATSNEPLIKRLQAVKTAFVDAEGKALTYGELLKELQKANNDVSVATVRVRTATAVCTKLWQQQSSTLSKVTRLISGVGSELQELGAKDIGKVVSAVGELGGVVLQGVNEIKTIVSSSVDAMQGASAGAAKAMSTVEKASIILTIISVAFQVMTKVFNLAKEMKNAKLQDGIDDAEDKIDNLKNAYEDLNDVVDRTYSKDKRKAIADQNANLQRQNELIREQMRLEEQKKEDDKDKESALKDYNDKIRENNKVIEENKRAMQDAIFGEDIQSAIESFADAYTSALSDGGNVKKAAKQMVVDMIKSMITESMKADLARPMQALRNKMEAMYADNIISPEEQRALEEESKRIAEQLKAKYEWANDVLKGSSGDLQGTQSGWASASQESIDELNGRFAQSQMALSGSFEALLSGNSLLSAVNSSLGDLSNSVNGIQLLLVEGNGYLENIDDWCRKIVVNALPRIARIEAKIMDM